MTLCPVKSSWVRRGQDFVEVGMATIPRPSTPVRPEVVPGARIREKTCAICSGKILTYYAKTKFCGDACRRIARTEASRDGMKSRYTLARENGLCVTCKGAAVPGMARCERCMRKMRERAGA